MLDNYIDVTSDATITKTITNSKNEMLSAVDISTPDTYKIKYKVIYKNSTYEKTRTVIVKEKQNNE